MSVAAPLVWQCASSVRTTPSPFATSPTAGFQMSVFGIRSAKVSAQNGQPTNTLSLYSILAPLTSKYGCMEKIPSESQYMFHQHSSLAHLPQLYIRVYARDGVNDHLKVVILAKSPRTADSHQNKSSGAAMTISV